MKTANKRKELLAQIKLLESQQEQDLFALKEQFHHTSESLKPLNFIKNTLHEVTSSSEIGKGLINGAVNLATGYISNKVLMATSDNPMKKALGSALKFVMRSFFGKKTKDTTTTA